MEELTPKSNGNGYQQESTSNDVSSLISEGWEMVSISIPERTSLEVKTEPGLSHSWKGCMWRVPDLLRQEERNKRDYDPAVVSLGPYHHGKPELKLVEEFKPKALELFAAECGKDPDFFYNKVLEVVHDLRRCYEKNSTDEYDDAVFATMMLHDGCFIVNYIWIFLDYQDRMSKAGMEDDQQMFEAMVNQLPIFKAIMDHLGPLVVHFFIRDMFLLENQVPFFLLKLLINLKCGKDDGEETISKFSGIVISFQYKHKRESRTDQEQPLHLLAAFRRILVADCSKDDETKSWSIFGCQGKTGKIDCGDVNLERFVRSFRSVTALKAKGIYFKPNPKNSLKSIKFKSSHFFGELQLPSWYVLFYTKVVFLNLAAFEICPGNITDQTVLAYINFMKSLIESPKDVKELREKHILINALGSDEEVMQVDEDINTFASNNYGMFYEVREKIQEHYNSKAKTWMAPPGA